MTTPDDRHPPTEFRPITFGMVLRNLMALYRAERSKRKGTAALRQEGQ